MANASTIRRQIAGTQQLTLAPLSGAVITTTETAFALNNNALTLTGGGTIPLSAGVTGLYAGTGQQIWIHAAGILTGGTASTGTLILKLYQVPASLLPIANTLTGQQTFTNWQLLATSATGTLAAATTSGNFSLDAYVQLDPSNNLTGYFESQVFASTTGAPAATTQRVLTGEVDLNFVVTVTLANGSTAVVTMDEFALALV